MKKSTIKDKLTLFIMVLITIVFDASKVIINNALNVIKKFYEYKVEGGGK